MTTQLQAVYENGILRPLQPLALAERQCVTITITNDNAGAALDQARFVLSSDRWEDFCALLDRPPRDIPALQKLLTQPSELDVNRPSA